MLCAYVGPFSSWAACIISLLNAAVASLTSVTWYLSSVAYRAVTSMQVFASKPTTTCVMPRCFRPGARRFDVFRR
jgi:hypothetical protein